MAAFYIITESVVVCQKPVCVCGEVCAMHVLGVHLHMQPRSLDCAVMCRHMACVFAIYILKLRIGNVCCYPLPA